MRRLLLPFGWLYGLGVWFRNRLFDWGILPSESFPVPVICVGNLIAGGSGKSPHVLLLAQLLKSEFRVAILSRGYGRSTKGFRLLDTNDTAISAGDEPLQYLHYLKDVRVAVCEDRREGIRRLLDMATPPQIILLDDAFQHRYVKAGFNILITESTNPFTEDHLLPAGMLRESKSGAGRADCVVVSKTPAGFAKAQLTKEISKYTKAPVVFSYMRYRDPVSLQGDKTINLDDHDIYLLTGIARPEPLLEYVTDKGNKVHHQRFPDHHVFTQEEIKKVKEDFHLFKEHPDTVLLTTRKDAMRLMDPAIAELISDMPVYIIDIDACIEEEEQFNSLIRGYVRAAS